MTAVRLDNTRIGRHEKARIVTKLYVERDFLHARATPAPITLEDARYDSDQELDNTWGMESSLSFSNQFPV